MKSPERIKEAMQDTEDRLDWLTHGSRRNHPDAALQRAMTGPMLTMLRWFDSPDDKPLFDQDAKRTLDLWRAGK
jgi:hypothetical protein